MSNINSFTIHRQAASLSVEFDDLKQHSAELSFEYLRVFAPTDDKGQPTGLTPKVYHKKQIQLLRIESVGIHGYRLVFDDGHSNTYSTAYFQLLLAEYEQRWQHYMKSANSAINSREATIGFKEVK
jgi:DUF971 family protein